MLALASKVASEAPDVRPAEPSVVGDQLTIVGQLESEGAIVIYGRVEGDVIGRDVVIGEGGCVNGVVEADRAVIAGKLNGPTYAREIEVEASARIVGNLTHNKLTVAPGAQIEGRRPWRP
jgi:cytoskeletal protein CcmA (bactofilin family)